MNDLADILINNAACLSKQCAVQCVSKWKWLVMHQKKEEDCSDYPTFVHCRIVELTCSGRLVCSCPQKVEESMVCHHIASVFGGTHSNFVNVCYNKH